MRGLLMIAAAVAGIAGAGLVDHQERRLTYRLDSTFAGDLAVVEVERGKLGLGHRERIVGYFLAGEPRAIGFGCAGARAPVIAVAAKYLPRCNRVAPIEGLAR